MRSINQLRTLQAVPHGGPMQNGVICIPRDRHPYVYPDGTVSAQPSHDSFLFYAGPHKARYRKEAQQLGEVYS